jgi:hypothetical protein
MDEFEPIHPHNFSHIQDGQRAYDEGLDGNEQRFNSAMGMGSTSQSIMHRASPLSNAKFLSRGDQGNKISHKGVPQAKYLY